MGVAGATREAERVGKAGWLRRLARAVVALAMIGGQAAALGLAVAGASVMTLRAVGGAPEAGMMLGAAMETHGSLTAGRDEIVEARSVAKTWTSHSRKSCD